MPDAERKLTDLNYCGLNGRVIALDRYTGDIVWKYDLPKGRGFVSLMLDGDRLLASVNGYIYCLDPLYGQLVWENPLEGMGLGIVSFASAHGSTSSGAAAQLAAQQAAAAAAAGSAAAASAAAG